MIGSHNSMSYLPSTKWWMKVITPWHRCQNKTIVNQYKSRVRYFDIRIGWRDDDWHFVHNRIDYGKVKNHIDNLKELARLASFDKNYIYFRFILDERKKPKDSENLTTRFIKYVYSIIDKIQTPNNNVLLDAIITAWNWSNIENTKDINTVIEYHASATHKWYNLILGTKIYSKLINTKALMKLGRFTNNNIVLVDYV